MYFTLDVAALTWLIEKTKIRKEKKKFDKKKRVAACESFIDEL